MRFKVGDPATPIESKTYPIAILQRDPWDDYGLKTTHQLTVHLDEERSVKLGDVKILKRGQESGATPLPDKWFSTLGETYCSLGQTFSYYEVLSSLGRNVYEPLLKSLRDVVFDRYRRAEFDGVEGFRGSLLRSSSAQFALHNAPNLFGEATALESAPGSLKFSFLNRVGSSSFVIGFDFDGPSSLPSRVIALIGYNGSGKTQLLANLAMAAHRGPQLPSKYGQIVETDIRFGSVIAVSYSAFDTFDLPGRSAVERARVDKRGDLFGYSYCGLRAYTGEQEEATAAPRGLKTIDEIGAEFAKAVARANDKQRAQLFRKAMSPLSREPSLQRIGFASALLGQPDRLVRLFDEMSAGHRIVVNMVAQLVAQLERRSLVLIDEPESHLHPPLLAALLRSVRVVLSDRDSFAIIATHSPVVLQETPAQHVRILRRFEDQTQVALPEIETFGENVGMLTREVFNLDSSATDYHDVLDQLSRRHTIEEIDAMFAKGLSSQARAYVIASKRRQG